MVVNNQLILEQRDAARTQQFAWSGAFSAYLPNKFTFRIRYPYRMKIPICKVVVSIEIYGQVYNLPHDFITKIQRDSPYLIEAVYLGSSMRSGNENKTQNHH